MICKKYSTYGASMFSTDHYFLTWRILGDPVAGAFWERFREEHPEKREDIDAAARIVDSARFNPRAFTGEEARRGRERLAASARRRRLARIAWTIPAAACALAVILLAFFTGEDRETGLEEMVACARERKIQLVLADTRVVELESNAEIAYAADGTITVREEEEKEPCVEIPPGDAPVNRLVVPEGRHASLTLPDGSRAWVNARTTIEFPVAFTGERREIRASGEIYLRVARDSARPFVLHAPLFSVSVLGTSFNVTAYPGEEEQSVVLVEGSVSVSSPAGAPVVLRPSERFVLSCGRSRVETVQPSEYTSWKDGVLQFTGRPLSLVLASLSRYYGVPIEHEGMDGVRLTGKLVLFDDLSTVLDNITVIAPLRYEVRENGIVIMHDEK
ncbi:MAG: FecR domain-containing protein [Odoribacteraceae bacterium]|jgi:ferric-dicitrate binding protein FerR (iron transport regulator)|nr:FecR domain-containing protein [Odoribacteraceae bacterium]